MHEVRKEEQRYEILNAIRPLWRAIEGLRDERLLRAVEALNRAVDSFDRISEALGAVERALGRIADTLGRNDALQGDDAPEFPYPEPEKETADER